MIARAFVVALAAGLLMVQVVRNAVVASTGARAPGTAARVWSGNPAVEISGAMAAIAQAARERREVPGSAFDAMRRAAVQAPLAPEPFLVRGVQVEMAGDGQTAELAFQ